MTKNNPHGIGSPEWEETYLDRNYIPGDSEERDPEELDRLNDEAWGDPDTYLGTYVPKGIEDDPIGRQPYEP